MKCQLNLKTFLSACNVVYMIDVKLFQLTAAGCNFNGINVRKANNSSIQHGSDMRCIIIFSNDIPARAYLIC